MAEAPDCSPQKRSWSCEYLPPYMSELNVILLGNSSSLKNSVGNLLLMKPVLNTETGPQTIQTHEGKMKDQLLTVVMTPDLQHINRAEFTSYIKTLSGPRVFLLVLQPESFTEKHKDKLQLLLLSCSEKAFDQSLVLISTAQAEKPSHVPYVWRDDPHIQDMMIKCKRRYLCINNNEDDQKKGELKRKEVFTRISQMLKESCEPSQEENTGLTLAVSEKIKSCLNLVLCGRAGAEKSSVLESIIGQSSKCLSSEPCEKHQVEVCGRWVSVLELPPLSGSDKPVEKVMEQCLSLCGPQGVQAFILVLPLGSLTDEDKSELKTMQDMFSSAVRPFMMVLFTVDSDQTVPALVDKDLQELCGGRHLIFNTRGQQQVSELLDFVETLKAQNKPHSFTTETLIHGQRTMISAQRRDIQDLKKQFMYNMSYNESPADPGIVPETRRRLSFPKGRNVSKNEKKMASNLQKYIQEHYQISGGPPARYRLPLQRVNLDKDKDESSKLRKFTLGERSTHPNKTVLLVGATGSGKSTLINALVNFVMGVKFEDKVWFEVITDENKESQAQSQTTAVSVYEVFGFEGKTVPYSLTIIDTPGYGDTRGIEHDDIVTKQLQDLFCVPDGVKTIDAVGLVLKATENRLDERMTYIFNSVTSLFGRDMEQNIVALMTYSDGFKPKDALNALKEAKVKFARDEKDNPVYFTFNNRQKETIGDDSDDEEKAERVFMDSNKGMEKFTGFLKKAVSQSVRESVEVMNQREQLTACIKNHIERVGTIEEKQKTIETNKEMLSKYQREMEKNEDFVIDTVEVYKELQHLKNNKAVTCGKCKETCHDPCDHWWFWCSNIFKGGRCTVCTGRCSTDHHVREKFIYETKTRTVKTTFKEMKAKYDESKKGLKKQSTLLEDLKFEMIELQKEKNKCLDDAFHCIETLEKIALNKDSASTWEHLDFLIEKMEIKDTRKVEKLKSMKKRMDENQKAAAKFRIKMKV